MFTYQAVSFGCLAICDPAMFDNEKNIKKPWLAVFHRPVNDLSIENGKNWPLFVNSLYALA